MTCIALLRRDEFLRRRSDDRSGTAVAKLGPPVLPQHQPEAAGEYSARASQSWQQPAGDDLVIDIVRDRPAPARDRALRGTRCDLGGGSRLRDGRLLDVLGLRGLARIGVSRDGQAPAGQDQVGVGEVGAVRLNGVAGRLEDRRVGVGVAELFLGDLGERVAGLDDVRRPRVPSRRRALSGRCPEAGSRDARSRTAWLRSTSSTYLVPSPRRSSAIFQRLSPRLTV